MFCLLLLLTVLTGGRGRQGQGRVLFSDASCAPFVVVGERLKHFGRLLPTFICTLCVSGMGVELEKFL